MAVLSGREVLVAVSTCEGSRADAVGPKAALLVWESCASLVSENMCPSSGQTSSLLHICAAVHEVCSEIQSDCGISLSEMMRWMRSDPSYPIVSCACLDERMDGEGNCILYGKVSAAVSWLTRSITRGVKTAFSSSIFIKSPLALLKHLSLKRAFNGAPIAAILSQTLLLMTSYRPTLLCTPYSRLSIQSLFFNSLVMRLHSLVYWMSHREDNLSPSSTAVS